LREALADPNVKWQELLANHDVLSRPTEEEARDYVICHIWRVVFPDAPPPKPNR
jgi:hypothetical protein